MAPTKPNPGGPLRLRIEPVVAVAEALVSRVRTELPTHDGLASAAGGVAAAARQAERVARSMKSPLSLHRLPAAFLAAALVCLGLWVYWRFFYVATLTLALPDRDAAELRERIAGPRRVDFQWVEVPGSREAVERVAAGSVDLAFVQGGLKIPPELPRLETSSPELVLWLTRDPAARPSQIKKVLTSLEGEGSHSVALSFFEAWQVEKVQFVHDWRELTTKADYQIADDIDAVFVVKDPADEKTIAGINKLLAAGFHLRSLSLGARASRFDFLKPATIDAGYLQTEGPVPDQALPTYSVSTFIVARRDLTPRLLGQAAHVLEARPVTISEKEFHPTTADASEIFQGIEAFMGIIVNIGLAFLALLG